jgi:hypothetical protein
LEGIDDDIAGMLGGFNGDVKVFRKCIGQIYHSHFLLALKLSLEKKQRRTLARAALPLIVKMIRWFSFKV